MKLNHKTIIISLGGSLIVPNQIDTAFLRGFKQIIEQGIKKGLRFVIITGGGKISRNYGAAAAKLTRLTNDDLDWLGIHATRLNAHLIRSIFKKYAKPQIINNPQSKVDLARGNYPIIVAAGFRPGYSTDYIAVAIAKQYRAKEILNLSNIDYVYDHDPKTHPKAKPIKSITWPAFQKIVGNKWDPNLNMPFDPVASKLAGKLKLRVIIMNGKNLENLKSYLFKDSFVGTIIA